MRIRDDLRAEALLPRLDNFFALAAAKVRRLAERWRPEDGAPVFTVEGRYTARGWTEWTQGFQFGAPLLLFDATGDTDLWRMGRDATLRQMAPHLTHTGVHDHGFNNISTYGVLRRLALEGRAEESPDALELYALALKVSGAVQAARWTALEDGTGFIHSFNGPHSLFSDTIRSCRSLMVAHALGHVLMGEHDERHSLRTRCMQHIANTARYNVYYGKGRDAYDEPGRVVHESIFNTTDGRYRCPSTQQGYSPFSTWTRGLAWIMLGAAEQLEALRRLPDAQDTQEMESTLREMATVTSEFYIANTTRDGIPFWDTGAPGLVHLGDWRAEDSRPDNPHEPVDSSAAAIAAQALLRLGRLLDSRRFTQAGLTVLETLLSPPYLSEDPQHEGLVLHAVYHRPNGWDHMPPGSTVPMGESCQWGDYHTLEAAVLAQRMARGGWFSFMDCANLYTAHHGA